MMNIDKPTVSVIMITYLHADFIQEAIDGVLVQECNFDIELIIADDNSPDETEKVVSEIITQSYPNKTIHYAKHAQNKGMMGNFVWALEQAKGKYIAFCEGDDYWTDPLKLQKQVDFLEQNDDYNVVGGASKIYLENSNTFKKTNTIEYQNGTLSVIEYLFKRPFHTATSVYRNQFKVPVWFSDIYPGDKFFVAVAAGKKKLKVLDDELAVYRVSDVGVTSNLSKYKVTELLKKTNYGLSKLYDYIPESDYDQLRKLINHNEVLIQFGSANGLNRCFVFIKYFSFLYENRNWINWKVFLSRLK